MSQFKDWQTKMHSKSTFKFYYAGIALLLALIVGGGSTKGIWNDHFLEICMIPALFMGFGNIHLSRFSTSVKILFLLIIFTLIIQFLPITRIWHLTDSEFSIQSPYYSFSIQNSLESALFIFSVLGFSLFLSRFTDNELARLFRFILIGLLANLTLVALQLSYSGGTRIEGLLPFTITSASFANENHFSTLAFATIPLLAFHYLVRIKRPIIYVPIAAIISFCLFAVGSRAGMAMTILTALVCLFWFLYTKVNLRTKNLFFVGSVLVVCFVAIFMLDLGSLLGEARQHFFTNTLSAIKEHFPLGTGLGTFELIYPSYEPIKDTVQTYANHVHNDYAELILETGIFGLALLLLFLILSALHFSRNLLSQAAGLSMIAIGVHSLIDYPLRTMAIAILFAYLVAILFSTKTTPKTDQIA